MVSQAELILRDITLWFLVLSQFRDGMGPFNFHPALPALKLRQVGYLIEVDGYKVDFLLLLLFFNTPQANSCLLGNAAKRVSETGFQTIQYTRVVSINIFL